MDKKPIDTFLVPGQPDEAESTLGDVEFAEVTYGRETLRCLLTTPEIITYKDQLVQALQELEQAEADLKAIKATYKEGMEAKAALIKNLSQKLSNGYEYRPVEVRIIKDHRDKSVTIIRTDNEETVRTRTMTGEEAQRPLLPGVPLPETPPPLVGVDPGSG